MMMMIMLVMIMLPVTLSAWLHRSQLRQALPGPQARSLDIPAWKYGKITRWIVLLIMDIMATGSCMLCVSRVLRVEFSCVEWVPVPAACVAWFYPVTQWIIYCPQTCQKQILELGSDWSPTDLFNRVQGGAANAVVGGKPDQHHLQKVEFIQHSVGKIYVFKDKWKLSVCFFKRFAKRTFIGGPQWFQQSGQPILCCPRLLCQCCHRTRSRSRTEGNIAVLENLVPRSWWGWWKQTSGLVPFFSTLAGAGRSLWNFAPGWGNNLRSHSSSITFRLLLAMVRPEFLLVRLGSVWGRSRKHNLESSLDGLWNFLNLVEHLDFARMALTPLRIEGSG